MASRFWVLGTGTWDASDTTHWAASSGGAGGQSVPGSSDTVTLDGSSGGGTVTVNTNPTIQSLTCGAFTGTLDFSANNNSITANTNSGFSLSGAGTRTINMGSGTWKITATGGNPWFLQTTTNLTFNAGTSTIEFAGVGGNTQLFGSGQAYYNLLLDANSSGGAVNIVGSNTFNNITINAPAQLLFSNGTTTTISSLTADGSTSNQIYLATTAVASTATLSKASGSVGITWCGIRNLVCSGGATFAATNSFNLGNNTGITITAPSGAAAGLPASRLQLGH